MKKLNRNTMAADFIGAAFCLLMAFALLMLYSGCSEDANSINIAHGGTEEETAYALTGRVGNVVPMMLNSSGNSSSLESGTYSGTIYAQKGAVVTVYELDSLTLEKTGLSIVNAVADDNGRFAIDSISFNSPYVMIDVLDSCGTINCGERNDHYTGLFVGNGQKYPYLLSAIVDLRNSEKVSVNSLTREKIPFLRKRYMEGLSFAQANEAAERDFLESLGIYENLGHFEKMTDDENSELAYVSALLMELDLAREMSPFFNFYSLNRHLGVASRDAFVALGEQFEQSYFNTMKMMDYFIGYSAKENGLERCTDAQEGVVKTIVIYRNYRDTVSVMCRSGKWTPGFKLMEHTNGTMIDNRDGKTYKTVTYNFGGITQTWMAENLDFVDTTSSVTDSALKINLLGKTSCYTGDPSCSINGRLYLWMSAMNIGVDDIRLIATTDTPNVTIVVDDTCKRVFLWEAGKNNSEYEFADETLRDSMMSACFDRQYNYMNLDYTKFVSDDRPVVHQGVCPDGWRIPNKNDWNVLFENLSAYYGIGVEKLGGVLVDDFAAGFALKQPVRAEFLDNGRVMSIGFSPFRIAVVSDDNAPVFFVSFHLHQAGLGLSDGDVHYYEGDASEAVAWETFVRCIKN